MTEVKNRNKEFYTRKRGFKNNVTIEKIDLDKVDSFNYEVNLKGKDSVGAWSAKGNFIMTALSMDVENL